MLKNIKLSKVGFLVNIMRLPFCFVNRNNVILPRGIGFLEEKRKITLGILVCERGNYLEEFVRKQVLDRKFQL